MARSFGNNVANFLSRASSLISPSAPRPISISIWLKPNNTSIRQMLFNNNYNSAAPRLYFGVEFSSSADRIRLTSLNSGGDVFSNALSLDTSRFNQLGVSWDTNDAVAFYHDGAGAGSDTRAEGTTTTDGAAIGTLNGSAADFDVDGNLAEFAAWNVILTSAEFASLGAGYSPLFVRPQSLVSYVPIIGRNSPELDRVDATTWAINGTLTVAPHAPMIYPAPPHIPHITAGAPPAGQPTHLRALAIPHMRQWQPRVAS